MNTWTRTAVPLLLLLFSMASFGCRAEEEPARQARGQTLAPLSIPLVVQNDQAVDRVDEPVRGGVALPEGQTSDLSSLRVVDGDGGCVPAQFHPLGLAWPDGSLRQVLVQFTTSIPDGGTANYTLTQAACPAPEPPSTLTVTGAPYVGDGGVITPEAVTVDTGVLKFSINRADFRLPNQVWYQGRLVVDGGADLRMTGLREAIPTTLAGDGDGGTNDGRPQDASVLQDFGLRTQSSIDAGYVTGPFQYDPLRGAATVTIEESGPLRAVIKIETQAPTDAPAGDAGTVGVVARIYAYAGQSYLRIELSLINHERLDDRGTWRVNVADGGADADVEPDYQQQTGNPAIIANAKHLTDLAYVVSPTYAPTASHPTVSYGTPDGATTPMDPGGAWTVHQDDDAVPNPGYIVMQWPTPDQDRVTIAAREYWERYPKAVATDGTTTAELQLWPKQRADGGLQPTSPMPGGRARSYEFLVEFSTAVAHTPPERLSAIARAELHLRATPESAWTVDTYFPFVPLNDPSAPLQDEFQENVYTVNELGRMVDRGDVAYGDMESPYYPGYTLNGYRGPAHALFQRYASTADRRYFNLGEAMVRHAISHDIVNWAPAAETPGTGGLGYYELYTPPHRDLYHGDPRDHLSRARSTSDQYFWLNDLVQYYLMTGNRRVVDLLAQIPNWRSLNLPISSMAQEYAPGNLNPDRPAAISLLNLIYAYQVVGCERIVGLRSGIAMTTPSWRTAYPAPLDCADDGPADRMFRGIRTAARYLAGQDQTSIGVSGAVSFDLATLDPVTWPNPSLIPFLDLWNAGLYRQTGFYSNYSAYALYYYWSLAGDPTARTALQRVAEFQRQSLLPTGTVQYDRHSSSDTDSDTRLTVGAHEVSGVTALAYLATGIPTYLDQGAPTLDWLLNYERHGGTYTGMNSDVAVFAHAMRRAGRSESSLLGFPASVEARSRVQTVAEMFNTGALRTRPLCLLLLEAARMKNEHEGGPCVAWDWLTASTRDTDMLGYCGVELAHFGASLTSMINGATCGSEGGGGLLPNAGLEASQTLANGSTVANWTAQYAYLYSDLVSTISGCRTGNCGTFTLPPHAGGTWVIAASSVAGVGTYTFTCSVRAVSGTVSGVQAVLYEMSGATQVSDTRGTPTTVGTTWTQVTVTKAIDNNTSSAQPRLWASPPAADASAQALLVDDCTLTRAY